MRPVAFATDFNAGRALVQMRLRRHLTPQNPEDLDCVWLNHSVQFEGLIGPAGP